MMNGVHCLICGVDVISTHRHDFRGCACPCTSRVTVDGGRDYKRRVYGPDACWYELDDPEQKECPGTRAGSR